MSFDKWFKLHTFFSWLCVIFVLIALASIMQGCIEAEYPTDRVRFQGLSSTIDLPCDKKFVNVQIEHGILWYTIRPFNALDVPEEFQLIRYLSDEEPVPITFKESWCSPRKRWQ